MSRFLITGGRMIKSFLKYAIALSLFLTSTISFAQAALEEMVVTSQKREQNLLDVPSALQAFSGDMLEDAGVRDTNDLTRLVPDMMMSGEDVGRANIWLRGIGSTAFDTGSESSNALFVDEIFMSRAQSVMTGLVDIERVEVLKGPQGTLYGRNALGGAISIYYKKPTSEFEQKLKAGLGDSGYQSFSYMVSGELGNNLYGRLIFGAQDVEGAHKETLRGEDDGPENQNVRFSLFGEGNDYEWSLTADYSKSDVDELVSEAKICEDAVTVCNTAQYNLIKASPSAAAAGIDIFQTNLAGAAAYASDAAGIASLRADKYSAASDIDTFAVNEDNLISAKAKFFRDDYDLTIIAATNQNQGEERRDFDATAAKSFTQSSFQKTNQSSFELRWNSKPEDQIQWVAGIYSFLDYGDRFDGFKTGPEGLFNQGAAAAIAVADGGLFEAGSLANVGSLKAGTYTGPAATKTLLAKTWATATAQDYDNWGTANLDLRINNKSSAAFGQVTIPMADRWNITLGARYSYDVKGMTYITSSNAVGVPAQLITPDCTQTCADFDAGDPSTWYSAALDASQKAVVDGAIAASGAAAALVTEFAAITSEDTAGNADYRAAFAKAVELQGVGIAPIASVANVFEVNKKASWSSTDPKMTIDYKPNDKSMVWFTVATGYKGGGWQFANYFRDLVEQGFDPEELEMYEIGYKGSFLDDSLRLSAAAYTYDWTDKQLIKVKVVQGLPLGIKQNAGSSTINGLDLNLTARVSQGTTLNFNYAYIDAQYDDYCDDSRDWSEVHGSFTSCSNSAAGAYQRAGGKMPWTPEQAMIFSFDHIEPTRIGDVVISGSYSYKSDIALGDERVEGITLNDTVERLNFSTAIEFNNGTTLRGFCTNCLDEKDDLAFSLIYPQSQGGGARVKYYPGVRAGLEVIHRF
jgi:outer membrane receptor protein involved in Fe transport